MMPKHRTKTSFLFLLVFALVTFIVVRSASNSLAAGTLTVTGVAFNHSSARIYFNPVSGAKDYRVYDATDPNSVKYAGLTNESSPTPIPATQIDWNVVGDGQPHTLVVEAVDALGPVPRGGLYDAATSLPLVIPTPSGAMIGSNKGPTPDGKTSTNGQGPYTNNPQVIALSQRFIVQANRSYRAIPSMTSASSAFFDTFENSEAPTIALASKDLTTGKMRYTMNAGTSISETIQYQLADVVNSMPFISADHFMDMLFDGGSPGSNIPLHQGHGVMAFSPDATAAWSNGQMLHITEEVDGHTDSRRWMDILITPANDPVQAFDAFTDPFNSSNNVVKLELFQNDVCTLNIFTGPAGGTQIPTGTAGGVYGSGLWGALGQAAVGCSGISSNGLGFDNKSRFDLFLTQRHAALFVDGRLLVQSDIPSGTFPWAYQPVKVYYSHYLYHTDNDISELLAGRCGPMNSFWFNDPLKGTPAAQNSCGIAYPPGYGFPRSDERHWDNMGFEVLPASAVPSDFATLASLVQPPRVQAPQFTGSTPPPGSPSNLRVLGLLWPVIGRASASP
jgi:hypothetical protein